MDNLRGAFGWSIETGDLGGALELASSLQPLWLSRGRIQEGLAWFDAVHRRTHSEDMRTAVRARALADRAVLYACSRSTTWRMPRRPLDRTRTRRSRRACGR